MKIALSKTNRVLCLAAIILTNIAVMADLVIIPIISRLYRAFPGQTQIVNYIVSGPMLIIVGSSLLTPLLLRKFRKKTVIVAGALIFTVGAVCGAMLDDALFIAAMRTLVGVGTGLVNVVAVSLIADLYGDEKTRAKITGYYNASMSFIGMAFSFASGWIAEAGTWQDSFKCFWAAIPMTVLLLLFVPGFQDDGQTPETTRQRNAGVVREALGWRYWIMAASWLVMNIIFGATVLYFLSAYIVENNIGDSAFTGIAAAVKSIVGFLISLVFGVIYGRLKRQTTTVCCVVSALCIGIMIAVPSAFSALVVATIAGCAYKVMFSYMYVHGFEIVPASRIDDTVAITTAVYGVGSFASTYFATFLMKAMNTESATKTFSVSAAIFIILAFVEIVTSVREKRIFRNPTNG
jgi:MFS family permease